MSFTDRLSPGIVVQPKTAEEVQEIVQWANQTLTPLVPVSSGPPHFRRDAFPSAAGGAAGAAAGATAGPAAGAVNGAVIVDLSGMKKVLRVDRRNRIAIIEPGLTYSELQPILAKEGMRVSMPLMPRGNKSVIASMLEREPLVATKYQWSLMEPLRSMEVIWGDGSRFWTGEAGEYVQDLDEQQKINRSAVVGMGPGPVDYYRIISGAQGTMAIVTWASVKCEILPSAYESFFVPSDNLENLIECLYDIVRIRFGDELFIVNGTELAMMMGRDPEEIEELKKTLPPWALFVSIAGRDYLPEEKIRYQKNDIEGIVRKHGFEMQTGLPGVEAGDLLDKLNGPEPGPWWKLRHKGASRDIFFMTTLDRAPAFAGTMLKASEGANYDISDLGIYIQPQHQGAACHCEFTIPYCPDDEAGEAVVKQLYEKASKELFEQGAYYSRPYGIWADMVYGEDSQNTVLLKKVKDLFDPNHILNPGKLCFPRTR